MILILNLQAIFWVKKQNRAFTRFCYYISMNYSEAEPSRYPEEKNLFLVL